MARRGFKEFMSRNYRYFIIGGLFIALVVVLIVVWSKSSHKSDEDEDTASTIPELETTVEVPKDKYEENAYADVNSLVSSYLNGTGDKELVTVWVVSGNTLAAVGGFPEDVWDVIERMTVGRHEFE